MYKTLTVAALLLAVFAFTSGSRSADASPVTSISPPIVARGKLVNQTAPIPTTTIFTPTQDGLYRLSVYGTISRNDPSSASTFHYAVQYTDDTGQQQNLADFLVGYDSMLGQFASYQSTFFGSGCPTVTFEAKAGSGITYSVTQNNGPDNSSYSLYYVLERLE
jgi:hypothetical protein